jgi:hypothetical protein
MSEGWRPPFIPPQGEYDRWGVKDWDMSDKETEHIWKTLLEPSLSTGHVRCRDLTRVKGLMEQTCPVQGPNMSGDRL